MMESGGIGAQNSGKTTNEDLNKVRSIYKIWST